MTYDTVKVAKIVQSILDKYGLKPRGASVVISEQLASRGESGVHPSKIYDALNRVRISKDNLRKFAEGLGEDPTPLLTAAGYIQPPEQVVESDDIIVRMRIQGDLTPEKQERIMRYVREIIEEEDGLEDEEKES